MNHTVNEKDLSAYLRHQKERGKKQLKSPWAKPWKNGCPEVNRTIPKHGQTENITG